MSIIVSLFMGLTISAEEIIKDAKILRRERFLSLSRSSYLFSKMLILFSFSALQSLLYTLVGNAILGIEGMTFIYWIILFSTSCFANMLGLNISQTFKSVITIYILIPILLIPQLILGGIVVRFDQINPDMHGQDKSPVIGDFMASRWAFEAIMVSQFRYNDFEKDFYALDQRKAYNEYKAVYYVQTLQTKLQLCQSGMKDKNENFAKDLALLRNEIRKEAAILPLIKAPDTEALTPARFDEHVANETAVYLKTLEKIYLRTQDKAIDDRDALVKQMTNEGKNATEYLDKMKRFQNERVEVLVTNRNAEERIVEYDGKLVHKIYPVFFNSDPLSGWLNYRSHFFAPEKHIFGRYIPTLHFNLSVIWLMSFFLFITLYFKLFRKLVNVF